jgi:hypothetical protein
MSRIRVEGTGFLDAGNERIAVGRKAEHYQAIDRQAEAPPSGLPVRACRLASWPSRRGAAGGVTPMNGKVARPNAGLFPITGADATKGAARASQPADKLIE